MSQNRIYLDHHATSPMPKVVLEAMLPYLQNHHGNAGSVHREGRAGARGVSNAREQVASLLSCRLKDVVFTGSGTEANNLAILGAARHRKKSEGRCHLVAICTEHESVLEPLRLLESDGFEITLVPVDNQGHWSVEDVLKCIRPDTILVSASMANYEIGNVGPVPELAKALKDKDIWLHSDAAVAAGWMDLNVEKLGVDLLSLSAHKFGGPKGAGALYVAKGVQLQPLMLGGYQERRRRPGAENVAAIVGMGEAATLAQAHSPEHHESVAQLRERLVEGIQKKFPELVRIGAAGLPGVVNLSLPPLEGEALLLSLDMEGVAVSSGAACTSGTLEPSHIMDALGVSLEHAQGSIRISLGHQCDVEMIDDAIQRMNRVIERLMKLQSLL